MNKKKIIINNKTSPVILQDVSYKHHILYHRDVVTINFTSSQGSLIKLASDDPLQVYEFSINMPKRDGHIRVTKDFFNKECCVVDSATGHFGSSAANIQSLPRSNRLFTGKNAKVFMDGKEIGRVTDYKMIDNVVGEGTIERVDIQSKKCGCGSAVIGSSSHSDYCDLYEKATDLPE